MIIAALRDGRHGRLQLHPRRDLRGLRALRGSARGGARRRLSRATTSSARVRLPAARATTASAPTSAARRRRCSSRSRARRASRASSRRFPASYGLYGKPTTINNTETFAAVPWIIMNGADCVPRAGQAEQRRHEDLLGRRRRREARQLRGAARHAVREAARAGRRRCASGRKLKARDPRRLVDAGAAGRRHDGARRWTTTRSPRPARCWARARSS